MMARRSRADPSRAQGLPAFFFDKRTRKVDQPLPARPGFELKKQSIEFKTKKFSLARIIIPMHREILFLAT
jgi:hypothetical protein